MKSKKHCENKAWCPKIITLQAQCPKIKPAQAQWVPAELEPNWNPVEMKSTNIRDILQHLMVKAVVTCSLGLNVAM